MPARRKVSGAVSGDPGARFRLVLPDEERLSEAHERASEAVADLDLAVAQELPVTDPKDPNIGRNVGVGSRQFSCQEGEYAVDPETGVVLKRL